MPPPEWDRDTVRAFRDASRRVVRQLGLLERSWRRTGHTQPQCHALLELDQRGSMTLGALADALRLDKSTVSRTVAALTKAELVRAESMQNDRRGRLLRLTRKGASRVDRIHRLADDRVSAAIGGLPAEQRQTVQHGMELYARALERAARRSELTVRPLRRRDDPGMEQVIRTVMTEYDASGDGFSIHDKEVSRMSSAYRGDRAFFLVIVREDEVLGGAGIAPLEGAPAHVCELKKMYFMPEVRGLGFGRELLDRCLGAARERGFTQCYLETLDRMVEARRLYERAGFRTLDSPMGCTGHHGCNRWYALDL